MARTGSMNCLAKRDLLASEGASPDKLREQARICTEAGQDYDALRFLAAAGDQEAVAKAAAEAVEKGDLFLYLQALRELDREPDREELNRIAKAAESKGLLSFAQKARELSGEGSEPDGNQTDG